MSVLGVSYDLNTPGKNYDDLYETLGSYTNCHMMDSYWLLDTTKSPADVRDNLKQSIDANDYLFVVKLRKHWAATASTPCTDWLKSSGRTWD